MYTSGVQNGMHVDFLDTFLLCSVGTQRKVSRDNGG